MENFNISKKYKVLPFFYIVKTKIRVIIWVIAISEKEKGWKKDMQKCTYEHFGVMLDMSRNAVMKVSRVKQMIERQKSKCGWEFLFLGANIDAVETAGHFGIDADRAVNYRSDKKGTALNYEVLSAAITSVRASRPLDKSWKKRIDEDYEERK